MGTNPVDSELILAADTHASRSLVEEIHAAARTDAKVLIVGETGVGKDLVAHAVHARSARAARRFIAVNCSGIPETLLESELFGHTRGSFTGAYRDKPGLARQADGGTLFLDELGEMSLRMQAVLLRFAETGEIQPIGATEAVGRINTRLIAATNRDLKARIAAQAFREDLYYRLNVIQIRVAPLRERPDDIPLLLPYMIERASQQHGLAAPTLTSAAARCLQEYSWPGNVRELKNLAERLVVRSAGGVIRPADLPEEIHAEAGRIPGPAALEIAGASAGPGQTEWAESTADALWRKLRGGDNFWDAVYEPFRSHDLTRADVHALVRRGLKETRGSYRGLMGLFNLPESDYKRFLSFLHQHDCHVPFQNFRGAPARCAPADPARRTRIAG